MALSIEDLRSFILVANERSVTAAALELGVSQQSVSERIRRLEGRIGARLFNRRPFGMNPTAAGFRLLPYATQIVGLMQQALSVVSDQELLRVWVQSSVSAAVVPHLGLLSESTRVETSGGDDPEDAFDALATGSLDAAVGVFAEQVSRPSRNGRHDDQAQQPEASADPEGEPVAAPGNGTSPTGRLQGPGSEIDGSVDLAFEVLFTDPVIWVAPAGHQLADRRQISLAELSASSVGMLPADSPGLPEDSESVRLANRSVVAADLAEGRLVELSVAQPGWVVPISMAYRASDHDRPAIEMLRKAIAEGRSNKASS